MKAYFLVIAVLASQYFSDSLYVGVFICYYYNLKLITAVSCHQEMMDRSVLTLVRELKENGKNGIVFYLRLDSSGQKRKKPQKT